MAHSTDRDNDENDDQVSNSSTKERCRIAVFGINRKRVKNILSSVTSAGNKNSFNPGHPNHSYDTDDNCKIDDTSSIVIEYLACVAKFDGYHDKEGVLQKYLARVDYYPTLLSDDNDNVQPQSLASVLDDECGDIKAMVIGAGIDEDVDRDMVKQFMRTLLSASVADDNDVFDNLIVRCAEPSEGFNSMIEENRYFRDLSENEKVIASSSGKMGPGKMVALIQQVELQLHKDLNCNDFKHDSIHRDHVDSCNGENDNMNKEDIEAESFDEPKLPVYDPTKTQYACKICRTILFSESDLEDPPHTQGKHSFSRKKSGKLNMSTFAKCSNIFLSSGLEWMGDMSAFEGRLDCPKCSAKVGHWNWSGAQCSCGSWVTPAIYFPLGKIDIKPPLKVQMSSSTAIIPQLG